MDALPANPCSSDIVLDTPGTPVAPDPIDVSGPAQSPQGDGSYPPITNDLVRVLDTPPLRHDDGYYVRTAVLCWRNELEAEIVSSPLIYINLY
jgi:hypothetical protein